MSTPTVLPAAALRRLAAAPVKATGTAGAVARDCRPAHTELVRRAAIRGALCLVVVVLAVAAGPVAGRLPWPVPAGAIVAGWGGLPVLAALGRSAAGRAGAPGAARLVLAGLATMVALWSALVLLAPAALVGGDRALAFAVGAPALVLSGALAAGLATGAELALLRWSLPALVAGAAVAGWRPVLGGSQLHLSALGFAGPVAPRLSLVEPLLLAGLAMLAARAFAPALRRGWWPRPDRARRHRSAGPAQLRRAGGYLLVGLSQAGSAVLVWRLGEAAVPGGGLAAVAPLLIVLPMVEVWVGWHVARVVDALVRYDDRERHRQYLRRLGWSALATLLPPLVAGSALAGVAARLPYRLASHPDAPALVLAMAGGVLLAGVVAAGRLLAARGRPGLAVAVTAAPLLAALGLPVCVPGLAATSPGGWGQLLPGTVVVLAAAYAAGLVLVSYALLDTRGPR